MFSETDFKLMGLWLQVLTRNTTLTLTSHEKQGPVGRKKAPPPTGMAELLCDQIETTMGHCNLFEWLNEMLTPLRLTPIGLDLSVREQVGLCLKSGPLVLLVQWESNFTKTLSKTQCKSYGQAGG
jgi:hypothetical protein